MAAPPDFSSLDPCVHCGFCLPACPTYLATGDEADSPRGRIVLMRALERGELAADDSALAGHLDACLGCPSGVGYGRGLEAAREELFRARGLPPLARFVLGVFRNERLWRPLFTLARWFRATGMPAALAGGGRIGFGMGMLAASTAGALRAAGTAGAAGSRRAKLPRREAPTAKPPARASAPTVALFRGCVMDTLFGHVHAATRRTLEANGYRVVDVPEQVCCGALHEHAGDREAAQVLAAENLAAFGSSTDYVCVNSAGCGALLKDYGHLLGTEVAQAFGARVRDVSELLAEAGPRPGAPLDLEVAYDAPCHLLHAQRVEQAPLVVMRAIPSLRLRLLPGSERCCGSAGIYSVVRPEMARAVLENKIEIFAAASPRPEVVATGNPGCLMQIGAGLRAAGLDIAVVHPVELLDESYRQAGIYNVKRVKSEG
jgi:glycolate oxidase iron-sulfur subunit